MESNRFSNIYFQVPKERTVYVSDIDPNTPEQLVHKEFSRFGEIEKIQMKQIPQMATKRSYFIIYKKADSMPALLNSNVSLNGKSLRVTPYLEMSQLDKEANIQIEDLDRKYDLQAITQLIEKYGKILSARIQFPPEKSQNGICYIQFENKEAALKCVQDSNNLGLKIKPYENKKLKNEKTTIYISGIYYPTANMEQLKIELIQFFSTFGQVEQVHPYIQQTGKPFAYIKFREQEAAEKAVKSESLIFNGKSLFVNWVISFNDHDIEANLFTKNIKAGVTEDQIFKAYSQLVPIQSVQIFRRNPAFNQGSTQCAYIYLNSSNDGKTVMAKAFRTPDVLILYENNTVVVSPLLRQNERNDFLKMKYLSYQQVKQQVRGTEVLILMNMYPPQQFAQQAPSQRPYRPPTTGYRQNRGYQQGPYQQQQQGSYQQQQHQSQQYQHSRQYNQPYSRGQQQQQQQQVPFQINKLIEFDVNQLEILKKEGEPGLQKLRSLFGKPLYMKILGYVGHEKAERITGLLLDFDVFSLQELIRLINDDVYLQANIQNAEEQLQAAQEGA